MDKGRDRDKRENKRREPGLAGQRSFTREQKPSAWDRTRAAAGLMPRVGLLGCNEWNKAVRPVLALLLMRVPRRKTVIAGSDPDGRNGRNDRKAPWLQPVMALLLIPMLLPPQ